MLLLLIPQGGGPTELDVARSVADTLYRLGYQGSADIAAADAWVTVAELYQWVDEAAKRLSYQAGLFIEWDTSITVIEGTAVYEEPAVHVYTVMAAVLPVSGAPTLLRITPVRELEALDANWPTTTGDAQRASMDAGSVGTITLYPNPIAGGTLAQVCQEMPAQVQQGSSAMALPTVLQDYFAYAALAGARGKESDHAMPEMARHFGARMAMYEQVIGHLWGGAQ